MTHMNISRIVRAASCLAVFAGAAVCQSLRWEPQSYFAPASGACMTYDPIRERCVMFGGVCVKGSRVMLRETREWDGERWHVMRPLESPPARSSARMAFDYVRGTVLLFGGRSYDPFVLYDDLWEYDGTTWKEIPCISSSWPRPRRCVYLETDPVRRRVVLFGGDDGLTPFDDTWEWDGANWTLMNPTIKPGASADGTSAYATATGKVMIAGLATAGQFLWEWDGAVWTSRTSTLGSPAMSGVLFATPGNGRVVLWRWRDVPAQAPITAFFNDMWEFDGTVWTTVPGRRKPGWRPAGMACPFPPRRTVLWANGEMAYPRWTVVPCAAGTDPAERDEDYWVYEKRDWRRIAVDYLDSLDVASACFDPVHDRCVMVIDEGYSGNITPGPELQTWVLEGETFRRLPLASNPPSRLGPVLAFFPPLGRVVMAGGDLGVVNPLDETLVFDGTRWVVDPGPAPPIRAGAMVFDGARGQLIRSIGYTPDLYAWSGNGWHEWTAGRMPAVPVGRFGYDPARQRLVFFGDTKAIPYSPSGIWTRDQLYEFDGTTWQNVALAAAPPRTTYYSRFVYVPWLGGLLLVPERGGAGVIEPLWVWTGSGWRTVPVEWDLYGGAPVYPGRGTCNGVAYDSGRNQLLAFSRETTGDATGAYVWRLSSRMFRLSTHHPHLGERLAFEFDAPPHGNELAFVFLSGGCFPTIPLAAADGAHLPLANDAFLQASAGLGLLAILDGQGRGSVQLAPIPNASSLLGVGFHAGAAYWNQQTSWFSSASEPLRFEISP